MANAKAVEAGLPGVTRYRGRLGEAAPCVPAERGPLELVRLAGVDLAGPEPLRGAVSHVAALVEELEACTGSAV